MPPHAKSESGKKYICNSEHGEHLRAGGFGGGRGGALILPPGGPGEGPGGGPGGKAPGKFRVFAKKNLICQKFDLDMQFVTLLNAFLHV